MNRIFKVIFSKTLGTHVVAGETAKSHGKKSLKAVVVVAMMAGVMGTGSGVMAADMENWNDGQKHTNISGDFDNANVPNARINVDGADSTLKVTGEVDITSKSSDSNVIYPIAVSVTGTNAEAILGSQTTEEIKLSAESSNGGARALQVTSKATLTGKSVNLTAKGTEEAFGILAIGGNVNVNADNLAITAAQGIQSNSQGSVIVDATNKVEISGSDYAIMAIEGHTKINAKEVEALSEGKFGIHVQNNTENPTAPEGAASVKIDADKITVTNTAEDGLGLSAFSNGQMSINGDLTVNADHAIDARGNSTININTDGVHKTVLNGDIVFETPNRPEDSQNSGKIINANVNVVLNGSDSVWNGKAYQGYNNGTSVELKAPPYWGNVTGFKVNLSNGAVWNATGDSFVNDLKVDNATVNISDNAEKLNITNLVVDDAVINVTGQDTQIKTETLGGDATVNLATESNGDGTFNIGSLTADETAEGTSLKVNYTGISADDVNNSQAAMKALSDHVQTPGASVTNNVAEGDVAGAMTWSSITENGQAVVSNVSEAKNSVMESLKDIGSNNFLVFRSQMNDLDKRMGDLRTMPNSDGAWARVIAGQSQYKSSHNTYQTLQVGADHRIGNFVLGATASYTDGDGTQKNGSTDDKNYSFGLYGAWLGDDGQFIDVTLKRHHTESDYDLRYTNGTRAKGSLDTSGTSISAEYGWRLGIEGTNYYIEPQVEFMYGHMNSFGYKTSNGVKVSQDAIKTAVGRIGMAAGWVDPNKAGSAYLKVSVLNDWEGDSYSKATKDTVSRKYHEDMGGTWVEYAIGGTYNLSKNLSIYGEAETTSGNPVRTTYQVSAGMRYSF